MKARRFTKRALVMLAVRVAPADRELLFRAAKLRGVSQSEMFREALREHTQRVLDTGRVSTA
jgi:uncharacterized protein (DUF1778 family)